MVAAAQLRHAGGGGAGNDEFGVGHVRLQRVDEPGAKVDFADADGVYPDDVTVSKRLLESRIVIREPLAKVLKPVAAPPHPPEIVWRR